MSKQPRSLTAGAAALVAAKSLSFALSIALPLVLVRMFDPTELGVYKKVFVIVQSIITTLPSGFCMTSYYFFPREPDNAKSVAFNAWLIAVLIGLVPCIALFIDPHLISHYIVEPSAVAEARWIGLVILLWSSSLFIELAPLANQDVAFASKFIVTANTLKAACLMIGALITHSLHGILVASVIYGVAQLAILIYYLQTHFPGFLTAFSIPTMKRQFAYFSKITPANLLGDLQLWLPSYFVGFRYTAAQFAVYANGCFNIPVTNILLESVGSILIRKINELDSSGDRREIIRLTLSATRKLAVVFFPFYVLMVVISREFIVTVFRDQYLASVPIFVLNISLVPISIVMFDPIGRAYPNQQAKVVRIRTIAVCVMLVLLWFGTAHFGPIAATAAVLIAALVERASLLVFWGRFLGATKTDLLGFKDIGRVAIASLGAGIVTWIARFSLLGLKPILTGFLCGCIFVPVYVALIFALRVPTPEERQLISGRIQWITRAARLA